MQQQERRRHRYQQMVAKLHAAGVMIDPPLAQAVTMPTRKHLADALVSEGWVSSFEKAFQRYLRKGQQAYVPTQWVTIAEAAEAIIRSEEHTSELQSRENLVCRLLLEKKK